MAPAPLTLDELARVEIVVARHRERSEPWIRALASRGWRVRVYDKSGGGDAGLPEGVWTLDARVPPPSDAMPGGRVECVGCDNVGREAETWLRHARDRYDALADLTLFLQGGPFDHLGLRHGDADALHALLHSTVRAWLDAGDAHHALVIHGSRTVTEEEGTLNLPVGAYYRLMFLSPPPDDVDAYNACADGDGDIEDIQDIQDIQEDEARATKNESQSESASPPTRWVFSAGAQYAVPRAVIQAHSRRTYAWWRSLCAATPFVTWDWRSGVKVTPGSVDPWTLERLWPSMWTVPAPAPPPPSRPRRPRCPRSS